MKLSDTSLIVFNGAAQREDRLVPRRTNASPVVDVNVCRALVKQGLVEIVRAPAGIADIVTVREDDSPMAFVISDAGFRALNLDPPGSVDTAGQEASTASHTAAHADPAHDATPAANAPVAVPVAPRARTTLREAATALLAAWDEEACRGPDMGAALEAPIATLRVVLAGRAPRAIGAPRKPRVGTKQAAVLTMLRKEEGTTIAHVMDATGGASHTVRGFLAGLKKKGIRVDTLERVRQVGPDKQGAKGSYSVYRVTPPTAA